MKPRLSKYQLFIFDWDGTLSTSSFLVRLSRLFKLRYSPEYIKRHHEEYANETDYRNIKKRETSNAIYSGIYDLYSTFASQELRPQAKDVLFKLKKLNKKIAVFSDSNSYRLVSEIKKLGMVDSFDLIISAQEIGYYKPDPTGLLSIIDRLKIKKEESIYIGDMASDILTARFAGISSCAISGGLDPLKFLEIEKPDYLIHGFDEMLGALEERKRK